MATRSAAAALALLGLLWVGEAGAGVNPGFAVEIGGPLRIEGPQVGQRIAVPVRVLGTTEVKGNVTTIVFDPAVLKFLSFVPGTITPGAIPAPGIPMDLGDGFSQVQGGSTLLGAGVTLQTTGGLLGTFNFEVLTQVPDAGSFISVVEVEVNTSSREEDQDIVTFARGQRAIALVPLFPNPIFNVVVERKHNGAVITWNTRLPGLNDVARVRPLGSGAEFTQYFSLLRQRFNDTHFAALALVRSRSVIVEKTDDQTLVTLFKADLGLPAETPDEAFRELARRLRELDQILRTRTHVVAIDGLASLREYEFELVSTSLDSKRSPVHRNRFSTRGEPDLRSLFISQFDVQPTRTGAAVSFGSNRPVVTTYVLRQVGQAGVVAQDTLNEEGETQTRISLDGLSPNTEYEITVTATLLDVAALVASGLPQEATTRTIPRRFRTHLGSRALRFLRPPVKLVGSERANIVFEANQPVDAVVDYGLVTAGNAKIAQGGTSTADDSLYTWQQESTGTLNLHNITLSNLDPSTLLRYKITLVNADGDTFTTDPRGNFQWSRDLQFRTAAAADTLPPSVILGPQVDIRDVLAVVRFVTDVPTSATVFIGTSGGTYNTEDEFEFTDLTPNGERRVANLHSIIVSGLESGETYRYRLEVESTNGKSTTYEPSQGGSGKAAGVQQPPGGAGSFTTSNNPDTQFPVILSGPTVSSKTHDSAVIEWRTDEPSDSEVEFGADSLDGSESSASSVTSHKMVLSNLTAGTSYTYFVASTDASGNGASESSQAVFTTNPEVDLTAPEITVTPAVAYRNDESATIQWTTDEEATGEVDFGPSASSLGFIRTLPTTDEVHSVTLTNLEPATLYFYKVSSSDLSNNGPTESEVDSFITDAEADRSLPAISGIEVAEADSSAIITWVTDELADSFVDFGTVSGILDLTVGDVEDVTEHEITLTNLSRGVTYFYTVGSIDRANNGPTESTQRSFTTLSSADASPPQTPGGLSGTVGNQQVVLSWASNTELDLAGYNVYRRVAGATEFSTVSSRVSGSSYADLGLTNDTAYEYRITAIDRTTPPNESAATAVVSLTPSASAAPTAPTGLRVGAGGLRPSFTFANAEPATLGATLTYTIQVSTQSDFSDVTDSESGITQGSGTTSWTIGRDLVEGATYFWRVRAVEGSLSGPFTDAEQFTASSAPALVGDFNDSGTVDFDDFFSFVDAFGKPAADYPLYDLNGSGTGIIDFDDFFRFVDAFGSSAGKAGHAGALAFAHRLDPSARIHLETAGGPMGALVGGEGANGPGSAAATGTLPRDVVRLRVSIREVEGLRAYGLVLNWDPSVLEFQSAGEGPGHLLESQGGRAGLFCILDQRPGRLLIGNGLTGGQPVSGSGLLAELTFRLLGPMTSDQARFDVEQAFLAADARDVRRVVAVESARVRPAAFALGQAYPNPFNPSTHIDFALAADTPATLRVYDVLGRKVRTLVHADESLPAGYYRVTWDGCDGAGRPVGNGVYFYRLETAYFHRTGKVMAIK